MTPQSILNVTIGVVIVVPLFIGQSTSAAELTPYSLPSQQLQYTAPTSVAKPPPRSDALESFYGRFADESRALNADARAKLAARFSISRETAFRERRIQEAEHFSRLVKILEAGKGSP